VSLLNALLDVERPNRVRAHQLDQKITPAELEQRAAADALLTADKRPAVGPDQGVLFSPYALPIANKIRALAGRPKLQGYAGRVESLRGISQALAEGVGVPLREGRFRAKQRKAVGAFFPHAEVARLVRMDKIDTAAHEIGHYVSKEYLRNPTMAWSGWPRRTEASDVSRA
jgi:hypothetical protein